MDMKALFLSLLLSTLWYDQGFSQIGGEGTYQFLDLTNSAKVAALGGTQIAFTDNDLGLTYYNPSLLSDSMRNQLSINYVSYIAGIGVGYAAFAPNLRGRNVFAAGIHYVNYGTFDGASETGQLTGTFKAAEYAINLYYSRILTSQLRIGVNIKPIFSSFEIYQSVGIAADLGITWITKDGRSSIALVTKNLGTQITTYYDNGDREKLPWDIQLGFSERLSNAPLKFFSTLNHLNKWNIAYENNTGNQPAPAAPSDNFSTTFMRHIILGAEIYPEKHVTLRFGYNYQRQKELAVDSHPGLVGFSAGLGVHVAKFKINYGIASFHLAATVHYFSLSTNLSQFIH
jgi:hypothetical protein